uniref:Uncharacterized protein n=1 Tax=Parascaris univalens TaxID=6257 RepID=A0A915A0K1_PARUN
MFVYIPQKQCRLDPLMHCFCYLLQNRPGFLFTMDGNGRKLSRCHRCNVLRSTGSLVWNVKMIRFQRSLRGLTKALYEKSSVCLLVNISTNITVPKWNVKVKRS